MNWNGSDRPPSPQKAFEDFYQDFLQNPATFVKVLLILVVVAAGFTSYYIVRAQEKAVVTRFGQYLTTSDEGLHFKFPFGIDRVQFVPTKIQQENFGFASSVSARRANENNPFRRLGNQARPRRSSFQGNHDSESLMLTGDLNVADVEWVVQYKVIRPHDFLFHVANPVKNIRDLSQTTMRRVVGDLSINDSLTTGRAIIERQVRDLMQQTIDETYKMGISIEAVILQSVAPPEQVKPSFNEVNSALQEQQKEINRAEQGYNRLIPEARGKAKQEISQAEGYAQAVINHAKGDAERFERILVEYRQAPEVTRTRMYLELVEDVMSRVGSFTVVDPSVRGLLPIFGGIPSQLTGKPSDTRAQLKVGSGSLDTSETAPSIRGKKKRNR